MQTKHIWTEEDDEFIKSNYYTMTTARIAGHLNRSESSVYRRAKDVLELGNKPNPKAVPKGQVEYVKANWGNMTIADMAKELGVNATRVATITAKLKRNGVIKPRFRRRDAELLMSKLRDVKERLIGVDSFSEEALYDVADEVEEILEVIKDKLRKGLE